MQKEPRLSEAKQRLLELNDRAGGMIGRVQYNPDLFTTATITQTLMYRKYKNSFCVLVGTLLQKSRTEFEE